MAAAGTGINAFRDLPARLRRPVSGATYRPEIDGLRFLAIAIVIVGHLAERLTRFFPAAREAADGTSLGTWLQRPGLGVYLFFAVSGFILASQAAKAKSHPLSAGFLRTYFGRRVLRIEPPYMLLLVATYCLIALTGYTPEGAHQFDAAPKSLTASLVGSLFYVHDLIWGTYPRLFPPGWSLEAEVQFYILAPLAFALWFALPRGAARVAFGGCGLVIGSTLSLLGPDQVGPLHLRASLLAFAHFFWLGLALADAQGWIAAKLDKTPLLIPNLLGWGGLACWLVLPNAPDLILSPGDLAQGMLLRVAALGCVAAMFAAVFAPRSGFRQFCSRPWISLIGGACYSLYLTHLQVIQAIVASASKISPGADLAMLCIVAIGALAAVLAVGCLFYVYVERVFMQRDWLPRLVHRLRLVRRGATS